jgi:hypothetical protein
MHLFISLIWFGAFMLFGMTLAAGAVIQAAICAGVAIVAAIILRSMAPVVIVDTHYRPEYHHHHHDPIHIHHDHRAQR